MQTAAVFVPKWRIRVYGKAAAPCSGITAAALFITLFLFATACKPMADILTNARSISLGDRNQRLSARATA
ncbi:hypothetical protein EB241_12460 [Erwinia psidii]|uniref:Uncharacterized protein n=1 Tax=Erwinia psidii TaxID=69224 RepID=A0A3N6S9Z2_9GAMM|nr:hypothetical protein EB241_12460 [Erwinia psidii]